MSTKEEGGNNTAWDVESIFSPPRHDFSDARSPTKRPPPRVSGRKRKSNEQKLKNHPTATTMNEAHNNEADSEDNMQSFSNSSAHHATARANDVAMTHPTTPQEEDFPIKFSLSHDYYKDDASFSEYLKDSWMPSGGDGSMIMGPSPTASPRIGMALESSESAMNGFPDMFQSPLRDSGTFDFGSPMSTPPRLDTGARGHPQEDDKDDNTKLLESPPSLKSVTNYGNSNLPPPRFPMELISSHHHSQNKLTSRKVNHSNDTRSNYSPARNNQPNSAPTDADADGPTQHYSPGQTLYNVASKSVGSPSSLDLPHSWRHAPSSDDHMQYHATNIDSHSTPLHNNAESATLASLGEEVSPEFLPPRSNLRGHPRSGLRENTITVRTKGGTSNNNHAAGAHKNNSNHGSYTDHEVQLVEPSKKISSLTKPNNSLLDPITPSPSAQIRQTKRHPSQIHQAVSDESYESSSNTSPSNAASLAPTVHQPAPIPERSSSLTGGSAPGRMSGNGGWSDSLHMAPLPPYVAQSHVQQHRQPSASWDVTPSSGSSNGAYYYNHRVLPPALPSSGSRNSGSGSRYNPSHAQQTHAPHLAQHGTSSYYSPYYQQQQQHRQHQSQSQPRGQQHRHGVAIPDPAASTSSAKRAINNRPTVSHHQNNKHGASAASARHAAETAHWRKHHYLLHQFVLQFGHCNVPHGYGIGTHYEGLYDWCAEQSIEYQNMCRIRKGSVSGREDASMEGITTTMTPTRIQILTSMGFIWGQHPSSSNNFRSPNASSMLDAVVSRVASKASSAGIILNESSSSLSSWEKWMHLIAEYKRNHGNCDVPLKYEPNPSLGTFVNRQRMEYRKLQDATTGTPPQTPSSLTSARIAELNALGFSWALRQSHTSWSDRFAELKEFRRENGHCNVPKIYTDNPSLGYWVNEQRFQYRRLMKKKSSYMNEEKIHLLAGLDFKWSMRESNSSWENWLKELRDYKALHGDVDVPLKYRHNPALGAFVNRQRTEYRKLQQKLQTSLNDERISNLNEFGFKWAIRVSRTPWETRLDELKKFKALHGHCNVPSTYPKNQPLAYWVFKQRGQYRIYQKGDYFMPGEKKQMCHMTPDRISKLDDIGFEWNPPRRIK